MARKARQTISYVLPLANSTGAHRLGVNGLAIDCDNSVLYSGGRDGVICAWDLQLNLHQGYDGALDPPQPTVIRQHVQAHSHWINDIALVQSNQALVSASSDIAVKIWRPAAQDRIPPQTVGLHNDYVKTLAAPSSSSDWIASGGLDRKICVWDLNGRGQKLTIDVDDEVCSQSQKEKGSVYALAARDHILASGGPESTLRVWDARTGKRITKLVGHTDTIRDILISENGLIVLTASSDCSVKIWDMVAGRCMYTLTMHDASVWSLYSDHPQLSVFYSADRNGLIAKTDTRAVAHLDEGISVAVACEHQGVQKLVAAGEYIWTATSKSSINRWRDVETENAEIVVPDNCPRASQSPSGQRRRMLPLKHMLKLSTNGLFPASQIVQGDRRTSIIENPRDEQGMEMVPVQPVRDKPDYTIEGLNGLTKHIMMSDRRRVLTLNTAGEVMMWDILNCRPIQSYGKRDIEEVHVEVVTTDIVTNWCSVDTRTGTLTVALDERTCFDAEVYADELGLENVDEDERINLGKWMLRSLFAKFIAEEERRDEVLREQLLTATRKQQDHTLPQIIMPETNGEYVTPVTPGINLATPGQQIPTPTGQDDPAYYTPQTSRASAELGDYFSPFRTPTPAVKTPVPLEKSPTTPGAVETDKDPPKENLFSKKFRMNMSFSMKKLSRTQTTSSSVALEPPTEPITEPPIMDTSSRSSNGSDSPFPDRLSSLLKSLRSTYEESLHSQLQSQAAYSNGLPGPSPVPLNLPTEFKSPAPLLCAEIPEGTTVLIQEHRPDAGSVADVFEGAVGRLDSLCGEVERAAPRWLGDLLLRDAVPIKETVKVAFVVEPCEGSGLPRLEGERLSAHRMVRARRVVRYLAERVLPPRERVGDVLELWCKGQRVEPKMTLASIRAHVWRDGGDVVFGYRRIGEE
ncbi:WD40 repeat-like protein, partial [Piedraia hortae CBS 480.64]